MPPVHRNRYGVKHHRCEAPGCVKWAPPWLFCCHQHNALLPYDLRVRFQTAWTYRDKAPEPFAALKDQALVRWGGAAGLPRPEGAPCPAP